MKKMILFRVVIIVVGVLLCFMYSSTEVEFKGTVVSKETIYSSSEGNSNREYRIAVEYNDGSIETYKVADSILYMKFDSYSRYSSIKEGSEYEFTAYGFRFGFANMFQNIIKVEVVNE